MANAVIALNSTRRSMYSSWRCLLFRNAVEKGRSMAKGVQTKFGIESHEG